MKISEVARVQTEFSDVESGLAYADARGEAENKPGELPGELRVSHSHRDNIFESFSGDHSEENNNTKSEFDVETFSTAPAEVTSESSTAEPTLLTAFERGDPDDPHNYPIWRKVCHSLVLVCMCFITAMSSAMYTPALVDIETKYNISRELALLSTGMVLVGYSFGPIIWSGVNEAFGRWYAWTVGFAIFLLFQIPTGLDPNFQTLLIGRFFQGFFGVSTLVTFGGAMSDVWDYSTRSYAAAAAVFAIFAAPALGPVISSFFIKWVSFGWISWIIIILGGVVLTLDILFIKETFPPVLLRNKAVKLRKEGHNVCAPLEAIPPTLKNLTTKYAIRPFIMLVEDKALGFLCVYAGISYGLLYTVLAALPVTFSTYRKFSFIPTYLPSISLLVGVAMTSTFISATNRNYVRALKMSGAMVLPDQRLKPMMLAAPLLPVGLFIFAWTAPFRHVHWIAPVIGSAIVGFSTSTIFISSISYMIESYKQYATSAFALNAIIRSLVAVLLLLVFSRMVEAMTLQGTFSFFGGVAILIAPGPFILHRNGDKWRKASKWA
ncbi:Tpo1p [Sugiyamaella lignohabitans]|uniref:Tpo1p n=1 Tax=Sugiyamaella lignohabitans TaxID=796027 RepID=A0A161HI22_9ASCO|nr:Tpo1p [Sugiyamaella lignohabitans]ANB12007.1 Tpo1p [Sugiyamaella lignohabitans]